MLHEILEQAQEVSDELQRPLHWAFDGTFGRGGHARALLEKHPQLKLVACDLDPAAHRAAESNFAKEISEHRLMLHHTNFANLPKVMEALRAEIGESFIGFDFMMVDLGVSSPQLDEAERGFSFYQDGPLDMRMDPLSKRRTAADFVNELSEEELVELFRDLGEVQRPSKVARAIVHDRKASRFERTLQLAQLIERVDGWYKKGHHPATLYFMGLRLAVNGELKAIEDFLPEAIANLGPKGRLSVLSFHSLEDRIVKQCFRKLEESEEACGENVRRKATSPSDLEQKQNPRSRSAKLRCFRRFAPGERKSRGNKYAHLAPPKFREDQDDRGEEE
jgi:16S rRNA (cytosine1402-N4)-methyltransferase